MATRDVFAEEMQKAVQEGLAQRERAKLLARRQERMARIRKWCVMILLVSGTTLAIVYDDQLSACMTTVWSKVSPGDNKDVTDKKESTGLPFVKDFSKARQSVGGAKSVNDEREKVLDDLNTETSGAKGNR